MRSCRSTIGTTCSTSHARSRFPSCWSSACDSAACTRLARRAGLGLARTGSTAYHGSGEIFLALATGLRAPRGERAPGVALAGSELNPLLAAAVEATEEAVVTSLLAATTVVGRDGNRADAIPFDDVVRLLTSGTSGG